MNLLGIINKVRNFGKYMLGALMLLSLAIGVSADGTAVTGLSSTLTALCTLSQTFLGIAVMIMVVLAGAIYAIGQILGAETRARATVWATAMLTGAIIGVIIYILAPFIIATLLNQTSTGKNICTTPPISSGQ